MINMFNKTGKYEQNNWEKFNGYMVCVLCRKKLLEQAETGLL